KLADVEQIAVYHNTDAESLPDHVVERIVSGTIDWITLTSSAIAARLHGLLPDVARQRIGRDIRLASLSPVTTEEVEGLGWHVDVEAKEYTWQGLVDALIERIESERSSTAHSGPRAFARIAPEALSAELEHRLDSLPEEEGPGQDEQNVHRDLSAEDPRGQ